MTRDEFYQYMYENVVDGLEGYYEKDEIVMEDDPQKQKGKRLLLSTQGQCRVSPAFNLDELYEHYLTGTSEEKLLYYILEAGKDHMDLLRATANLNMDSYDDIRDQLTLRIYSNERAKEFKGKRLCDGMPFFTVSYQLEFTNENRYSMTIPVTESHLTKWGKKKADLQADAFANQIRNGVFLVPLNVASNEVWDMEKNNFYYGFPDDRKDEWNPIFCLTNKNMQFGASLMLNGSILRHIYGLFGTNFFILPSSVHEVMIVPDFGQASGKTLSKLVREINEMEVAPYERICDDAFYYAAAIDTYFSVSENAALLEKYLSETKSRIINICMKEAKS